MKSYLLKDVVVVDLCWFLVDFKCPAPYIHFSNICIISALDGFRIVDGVCHLSMSET